jgi:hypothetical protein
MSKGLLLSRAYLHGNEVCECKSYLLGGGSEVYGNPRPLVKIAYKHSKPIVPYLGLLKLWISKNSARISIK